MQEISDSERVNVSAATNEPHPTIGTPAAPDGTRRPKVNFGLDRYSGIYVLAAIILVYGLWIPHLYLTTSNLDNVLGSQAVTGILSLGLLLPLAAGVFDLSIAAIMGLAEVVVIWVQYKGYSPALGIVAAIVVAALVGVINGWVVVKLHLDSFIATLGMSSILAAAAYWVTSGSEIVTGISNTFLNLGTDKFLGIGLPVYLMVVVGLVIWFFLDLRPLGRYLYAVGGNPTAARLAGVRSDRIVFGSLVASASIAGIAGVVLAAEVGNGNPTAGPPYLLPAFTAVFLGATQIKRNGQVNVPGTIIAVYVIEAGIDGLQLAGAPSYVNDLFDGLALIVAVALAVRTVRRRGVRS